MSLECDPERTGKRQGADGPRPGQWYFFTSSARPSKTGKWGWRVEGHHLSLNFTLDKGKLVSATPAFFGANPAGSRSLAQEGPAGLPECRGVRQGPVPARSTTTKRSVALQKRAFPEIEEAAKVPTKSASRRGWPRPR